MIHLEIDMTETEYDALLDGLRELESTLDSPAWPPIEASQRLSELRRLSARLVDSVDYREGNES